MEELRVPRFIPLLLAASLGLPSSAAFAQAPPAEQADAAVPDEARARYERGIQLYNEQDYDAALLELERAYKLAPSFRILYNIAKVYRQRKDYAGAVRAFERYLREGGADVPPEKRTEVEQQLTLLKSRVGRVDVRTNVPGAEVTVDDVPVGTTPLQEPVLVNVGRRRIGASMSGRIPVNRLVSIAGNDSLTVDLELQEAGSKIVQVERGPAAGPTTSTTTATSSKGPSVWIAWSATALLAGGAVAGGVLALNAKSDLNEKLKGPLTPEERDTARDSVKRWALLSDVATGGAVVVGAFALYLTLKGDGGAGPTSRPRGQRPTSTSSTVGLSVSPTRLGVLGTF